MKKEKKQTNEKQKMIKTKTEKKKLPNLSNITQKWVDLLVPFSDDYSKKISASELARRSRIPQQTASRYLNKMAKLNILNYVIEGKNKLFYLELEKQTSRIMLNMIEQHKSLKFQLKVKGCSIIINELLRHCESIVVFGSYASGDYGKESDLDLVILGKCSKEQAKKIKQRHVVEINEHYATYNEFNKIIASRNPLSIEIMKNHVLFGNVSKIVEIFLERLL